MSIRKKSAVAFVALITLISGSQALAAGNGSSGTGNGIVTVGGGLATLLPDMKSVARKGDYLVDTGTGEKLVRIERVKRGDFAPAQPNLVPAQLGRVKGYEYLPDRRDIATQDNYWIVCGKKNSCLRLIPVSRTNPKVQDIIGGLRAKE